ncbi:hypothetical protein ACWEQ8_06195 [Streptomyces noursei]
MRMMLFSISESGWWLIAMAATAFFLAGMWMLARSMKLPEDLRATEDQPSKATKRAAALLTPVCLGAVLGVNLLRPEPAPAILFLYSVALISLPVAVVPVRGRLLKHYIAQKRNDPRATMHYDGLSLAWMISVLSVACLGSAIALTSALAFRR